MISENLELIEEITANFDNISEGELVYVSDGSEDGTKGLTPNGIEELRSLLADIRTWTAVSASSSSRHNAILK